MRLTIGGRRLELHPLEENVMSLFPSELAVSLALGILAALVAGLRLRGSIGAEPAEDRIGPYTLREAIGAGGMGVVFRAEHDLLARPVALKIVRASDSVGAAERFALEARTLACLSHPNIVAVHDYGYTSRGAYCAMELLDGVDLERLLATSGPQDPRRVVHLLVQACEALAAAHAAGLVHRDIKPANLFLCRSWGAPDVLKVLDFGLVRELAPDADRTLDERVVGTPHNMAPECFSDPASVGPAADLYALGTVAYSLLAGAPVFAGRSVAELAAAHLYALPVPVRNRARHAVSAELSAAVMACLRKLPGERPASALALRDALLACPEARRWLPEHASAAWRGHVAAPCLDVASDTELESLAA